jgi:hypothetical protein
MILSTCLLAKPNKAHRVIQTVLFTEACTELANAAQISFAERAPLRDQNHFLTRMNNEAKVRRSTKSVVLGKAKVMCYEDIEEARTKRTAKDGSGRVLR